jgi:hypothetical protein
MLLRRSSFKVPKGLSFEIPDLLLVQAWAEYHSIRMEVELHHCAGGDEYEEMLGLFSMATGFRRWMLWRSCDGIIAQPMVGRPMIFDTISEALDVLIPALD